MNELVDIFRCFAIAEILIALVFILRSDSRKQDVYLCAFFCFNVLAYLVIDWKDFFLLKTPFLHILLVGTHILTFSFWLFSKTLFDDDFEFKPWLLWIGLGVIIANYAIYYQVKLDFIASTEEINVLLLMLQKILALVFIILGH